MKKIISYVMICFVFIIIYLIQINIFNYLPIFGVKPNLIIIFILSIALFAGSKTGFILGSIFGVLIDLFIARVVGISAVSLAIIALPR